MIVLHGTGVCEGIAIGKIHFLNSSRVDVPQYSIEKNAFKEHSARYKQAINEVRQYLDSIEISKDDTEVSGLISAYGAMLDDPMLLEAPINIMTEELINIEWALKKQANHIQMRFESIEDAYLKSRGDDIVNLIDRVQNALLNRPSSSIPKGENIILATDELSPTDALLLKDAMPAAVVTEHGSPISHAAILARSLKIPSIMGLDFAIDTVKDNQTVIIDGRFGIVIVEPSDSVLNQYEDLRQRIEAKQRRLRALVYRDAKTTDDIFIDLLANVESADDVEKARELGAKGVGLFRTEYLFLDKAEPPSEETQYTVYKNLLTRMQHPVTVRTLDLGGDKVSDYYINADSNPLGLRGLRYSLHRPDIFRTQLRALLRASVHGELNIMVPMVTHLTEVDNLLTLRQSIEEELIEENVPFNKDVKIGIMIEVPAAAISAHLFAEKVDFLSIGTNDLIQYTLAIDRTDDRVNYLYDPEHPSVMYLIQMVINAGIKANKPVSMCGEMAGDPKFTRKLLKLGLRQFSMDPSHLLEVKNIIINTEVNPQTH